MSENSKETTVFNKLKVFGVIGWLSAGLTFAAGTGYTVLQAFDSWVDNKINSKIEPYQKLITGIALVQDNEFDDAVIQLEQSLKGLSVENVDEALLKTLLDHYMVAIVESDDIIGHEPDFNILKSHLKRIPNYGWHSHELGWYYLRTGDVKKAVNHFEWALVKLNQHRKYRDAADSYWALSIVELIKGDLNSSIEYTVKAEEANPLGYSLENILKDKEAMKKDEWFARLMRIYPAYGANFDLWIIEIEKLINKRKL